MKSNGKRNTSKVQKHYSRKHHALPKFVSSLPQKIKSSKKGLAIKPMIFSEMNSRAQVDLIDMQSQPGGDFKWILVYQEHLKYSSIQLQVSCCCNHQVYIIYDI